MREEERADEEQENEEAEEQEKSQKPLECLSESPRIALRSCLEAESRGGVRTSAFLPPSRLPPYILSCSPWLLPRARPVPLPLRGASALLAAADENSRRFA